jgi:hypothetical protein
MDQTISPRSAGRSTLRAEAERQRRTRCRDRPLDKQALTRLFLDAIGFTI